jgi:glucokinase
MLEIRQGEDKNAKVTSCALENKDPLCSATLRLFCEIYGAEAGNLALKSMALGGVYIGGGIAPKILPFLQDGSFLKAFLQKGRFEAMLKTMKVRVSLNQQTALLGALHYAADKLR